MSIRPTIQPSIRASIQAVTGDGVSGGSGETPAAPANTVLPVISGALVVGQTLSVTDGTWTGTPTITYTYQWRRNNSDIGGATSNTYTLVQADAGNVIDCVVTATNGAGTASATAADTTTIYDIDANTYLAAVETADGQALESGVRQAVNSFVIGCKSDAIWDDLVNCLILCGARTIDGAFVPFKGVTPTNDNFVSGDYSRTTGLAGNASSKSIATNTLDDDYAQNDFHQAAYVTAAGNTGDVMAVNPGSGADSIMRPHSGFFRGRTADLSHTHSASVPATGLIGYSRAESGAYTARLAGTNNTVSQASAAPSATPRRIYSSDSGAGATSFSNARLAFTSLGSAIDLSLLDSRVTTLVNAIGAALA